MTQYELAKIGKKQCNMCKGVFDIESFRKAGFYKSGKQKRSSRCSECNLKVERPKRSYTGEKAKSAKLLKDGKRECRTCKTVLPLSKFTEFKSEPVDAARRWDYYCKDCRAISQREWKGSNGKIIESRRLLEQGKKKCPVCDTVKTVDKFYTCGSRPDGSTKYATYCKKCTLERKRVKGGDLDRMEEKLKLAAKGLKKCSKCGEIKDVSEFGAEKGNLDGLKYACKTCTREQAKNYRENSPDRYRAAIKRYRKNNPEYFKSFYHKHGARRREIAASYPHNFEEKHVEFLMNYFNYSCAICGLPENNLMSVQLTLDHWEPLSSYTRGDGKKNPNCPGTVPENMVVMCKTCNSSKSNRSPKTFYKVVKKRFNKSHADRVFNQIAEYFNVVKERFK